VDGGERGVMFDRFRGVLDDVYGEGTWLMVPWLQKPQVMDIRTRPRAISSVTGTKDLQMVNLSLRVLSRPDKTNLPWIVKVCCAGGLQPAWPRMGRVRGADSSVRVGGCILRLPDPCAVLSDPCAFHKRPTCI
jgi:regulator of protease activity HflC (stomatin/prohibitin superfamily)